jgi:hypothetical protein
MSAKTRYLPGFRGGETEAVGAGGFHWDRMFVMIVRERLVDDQQMDLLGMDHQ